jgi:hypothetical protein
MVCSGIVQQAKEWTTGRVIFPFAGSLAAFASLATVSPLR